MGDGWRKTRSGSPTSSSCTRSARATCRCTSQFVEDRWLDVFTPDAVYTAFGTPYTLDRFPALLAAAPRGQFIGNMPVVEFDGDARHRHAALRLHRPADARDAAGLVQRRVRPHRRRLAHPPPLDHLHAQARRLRLRATSTILSPSRTEGAAWRSSRRSSASTTTSSSRAHVWQERLPARSASAGPRVERARWGDFSLDVGRVVQAGDDRGRHVGRLLGLRGPARSTCTSGTSRSRSTRRPTATSAASTERR